MPSLMSRIINVVLRLQGRRKRFASSQGLIESGKKWRINDNPSKKLYEKQSVSRREFKGRTVWTVAPKKNVGKKYILYLHGGCYSDGFKDYHWEFISKLVSQLCCTVVAPDYPLAPEQQVKDAFAMVFPLYQELLNTASSSNLIVMGDSAGGAMALALAMHAREEAIEQPSGIVMLSPWLDVTMVNPEAQAVDKLDPLLDIPALQYFGKIYAGKTDPTNYLVSPIYGNLKDLAPITVFIGTYDLLVADCRKLKATAEAKGIKIDYHEYESMPHVWMFMPSPEAKKAIKTITDKFCY